ncbi:MAG: GDP-mannose 4,6-dehydratase [Actinomycetota bacterium]|nr:GDP-mannose 4,6-dehydratase [Actinomycetota bacterium]MDA8207876.1 GDP-mannose 4,6-dehydratase [Actinomycetota bacterium]
MFALITGSHGFVGPYLVRELHSRGHQVAELAAGVDITDRSAVEVEVKAYMARLQGGEAGAVFHLAALSHVGRSWSDPASVIQVNVGGTANLLGCLADAGFKGRFLFVSSAEVYGNQPDVSLIEESAVASPLSPYAASKLAAEVFVMQARRAFGLDVLIARPFNHIGPGQSPDFLVSALAKRIVAAERSGAESIAVGNLSAVRDFLDVRDVVRAYCDIVEGGSAGELFNVASGQGVAVSDVLERMLSLAGTSLRARVSESLVRKVEVPRLVGDASKLRGATSFRPEYDLDSTLADVLAHWRRESDGAADG